MPNEDQDHIEKSTSWIKLPWSILWKTTLTGALLISAPVFIHAGFEEYPKTHRFLEILIELSAKLGDAFVIAALLVVTIDEETRLRLIEAVVRAASPKLIGRHLPEAVQNAVLSYFKIDFYRPNLLVEYEFVPLVQPSCVKIVTRITGSLRSSSPNAETFHFAGMVDPPVIDLSNREPLITYAKVEAEDGTVIFERKFDQSRPNGLIRLFEAPVPLRPGTQYETTFELIEYRPLTYFLPLYVGTTAVSAIVKIRYPHDLFEISLQLPTIGGEDPIPDFTYSGMEWKIRNPILSGQCILTMWTPKTSAREFSEAPIDETSDGWKAQDKPDASSFTQSHGEGRDVDEFESRLDTSS